MVELTAAASMIDEAGIVVIGNSPGIIQLCSDKAALFEHLRRCNVCELPWTASASSLDEFRALEGLPERCVVKPATGSGGSAFVALATSRAGAEVLVGLLTSLGRTAVIQEYVPEDEGEFTIGVLSLPDGKVAGSVAMRRLLNAKLSVLSRSSVGVISSGYSQGLINDFGELRVQAEAIAHALGSVGPMNVQGRVRNGSLLPFEVNPRFSASTYLRALAGFNEVDALVANVLDRTPPTFLPIRAGYYLRSLQEVYVPPSEVMQ
jgi:carbamoyl-phosphate synthase large subunit